ncbi:MAG: hypothetical protein ACON5A_03595 [Candidatus Comchoanobacterales bacterium]
MRTITNYDLTIFMAEWLKSLQSQVNPQGDLWYQDEISLMRELIERNQYFKDFQQLEEKINKKLKSRELNDLLINNPDLILEANIGYRAVIRAGLLREDVRSVMKIIKNNINPERTYEMLNTKLKRTESQNVLNAFQQEFIGKKASVKSDDNSEIETKKMIYSWLVGLRTGMLMELTGDNTNIMEFLSYASKNSSRIPLNLLDAVITYLKTDKGKLSQYHLRLGDCLKALGVNNESLSLDQILGYLGYGQRKPSSDTQNNDSYLGSFLNQFGFGSDQEDDDVERKSFDTSWDNAGYHALLSAAHLEENWVDRDDYDIIYFDQHAINMTEDELNILRDTLVNMEIEEISNVLNVLESQPNIAEAIFNKMTSEKKTSCLTYRLNHDKAFSWCLDLWSNDKSCTYDTLINGLEFTGCYRLLNEYHAEQKHSIRDNIVWLMCANDQLNDENICSLLGSCGRNFGPKAIENMRAMVKLIELADDGQFADINNRLSKHMKVEPFNSKDKLRQVLIGIAFEKPNSRRHKRFGRMLKVLQPRMARSQSPKVKRRGFSSALKNISLFKKRRDPDSSSDSDNSLSLKK